MATSQNTWVYGNTINNHSTGNAWNWRTAIKWALLSETSTKYKIRLTGKVQFQNYTGYSSSSFTLAGTTYSGIDISRSSLPDYDNWYDMTTPSSFWTKDITITKSTSTQTKSYSAVGYVGSSTASTATLIVSVPVGITSCGAPTTVNITNGVQTAGTKWIVKPGNTLTFSWSGATAGTNNSISGYRIYWKQSAWPSTTSYDGYKDFGASASSGTINSTECTLIGASAPRGNRIGFCIVTKGAAGTSYWSSTKKIAGADGYGILINRLPSAPTLNITSTTISSTSTGATIVATAGTDGDGQNYSTYYSTSSSSSAAKTAASSLTLNPSAGSSVTRYWWTSDSLEYSSTCTACTVTKNSPITLTTSNISYGSLTTYKALGSADNYYTSRVPITITPPKAGTVKYSWKYQTRNHGASSWGSTVYTLKTGSASASNSNPKTWNFNFAYDLAGQYDGTKDYRWWVELTFNDGIEDGSALKLPVGSNAYWYYSAAPSQGAISVSNTHSSTPIGSTSIIGQLFRVVCQRDTSWNSTVVSVYNNTARKNVGTEVSDIRETDTHTIDITLTEQPASNSSLTITVQFLCSGSTITKSVYTGTVTEAFLPTITYTGFSQYNVYDNPNGSLTTSYAVSSLSGVGSANDYTWYTQYGSASSEIPFSSWSSSGANITATVTRSSAFNFSGPLTNAITNYAGKYTIKTGICYTNQFGQKILSNLVDTAYNFDTSAVVSTPTWSYSTSTAETPPTSSYSALSSRYIQEGLPLKVSGNVKYYSNRKIKVTVYQNSVVFGEQVINVTSGTNYNGADATYSIYGNVVAISGNQVTLKVKAEPINDSSVAVASATETSTTQSALKLISPISSFNSCELSGSTTFNYTWTSDATAIAVPTGSITLSKQYYLANSGRQLSVTTTCESTSVSVTVASGDWTTQNAYLAVYVEATSPSSTGTGWTTKKIFTSPNFFLVSKDNPTVSYRPNFVGINTSANMTAPSDEIAQIRAIAGHNSIRFKDENGIQAAELVIRSGTESNSLGQLAFPSATDTRVEINSNGIYMNDTENHIQVKNLDITPTSISLPSDGKIYINSNDLLLDILYPVGSTVCMSNLNANPSTRLGGTWELADKQFINLHSSNVSSYFTAVSSAIKSPAIRLYRAGHSISIRLQFATVAAISTTSAGIKLGEFDLEALGIRDGSLPTPRPLFWGGGTSQSLLAIVNTSGELMGYNVVPSGTLPANTTLLGFWTLVAPPYMATDSVSYMLDSACDKFYFTRTS